MHNKKRSKHHTIANAQKRKKRNKQKFYNRTILPRIEAAKQKAEAKKKRAAQLKKGPKKRKPAPKKKRQPQKKAR